MTSTEGKKRGRWKAGESGNPNGRKFGTGEVAKLRESIAVHLPEIISQIVSKAKDGDLLAVTCRTSSDHSFLEDGSRLGG